MVNGTKDMSDWMQDIMDMHKKFLVNDTMKKLDAEKLLAFLNFRYEFLLEELTEMKDGIDRADADLIVDSLIDLAVITLSTLDAFEINADVAWERVHSANMTKIPGVKASRPNKFGLPDLIKPPGFTSPTHHDNIGLLEKIWGS